MYWILAPMFLMNTHPAKILGGCSNLLMTDYIQIKNKPSFCLLIFKSLDI